MDRLVWFIQCSLYISMYIVASFIGAEVLDIVAAKLHVKTINLGWAVTVLFLPVLFPIVAIALLLTAIANIFRRERT